jgi:hypothetical protein|tara:strand:+ start:3935 stop:4432 length:498 start_codon:yes stop_codon:yes gene_type:complete
MTKKELVKIIQEVVRREVQKEVKQIFITEGINSLKAKRTTLKSTAPIVKKKPIQKKVVKKRDPVNYTSNESLNSILNETVGLGKGDTDEYPTMGGGVFDSTRATELLGYGEGGLGGDKETARKVGAVQTMKQAGVSSDQLPESLVNALTKDYSKLMKHDKMKSNK